MKTIPKFKMKRNFGYLVLGIIFSFHSLITLQAQVIRDHRNQTTYKPLEHYWSNARTDNFTTATAQGKKAALLAKYRFVRKDGYVLSRSSNNEGQSVPLYLYYNAKRKDNFTTATSAGIKAAQRAGYKKIRIEGYILKTVNSNYKHLYKPLWLYYNDKRKDNFTIASSAGIRAAEKGGYRKVRIEGYVRINNTTNASTAQTTDPFERLKTAAKKTPTERSQMSPVKITVNNPNWKVVAKPKITFVPFKLEDKNGKAISPNEKVTLKNGKVITVEQFVNRANEVEKKLNAQGYSLRTANKKLVSRTVTDRKYLDARVPTSPKAKGLFKEGNTLKKFMSLQKRVKVVSLSPFMNNTRSMIIKPYSLYNSREKKEVDKYVFSGAKGTVQAKKLTSSRKKIDFKQGHYGNLVKIYEFDKTIPKRWDFGDPKTFQVGIEGSIRRYAKIYPFDPDNPEKNKSEFKVSAKGKAWGSLFGNSMELLNASGEFYAPSDITKKMTAKVHIKALGTTLFNVNKEYPQKVKLSDVYGKSFDKNFPIEVPIVPGIDFKGLIGIKGEIGFQYGGEIYRTLAAAHGRPIINLEGYAEAGVEFLDILGGGVGGKLSFIKGQLDLQAYTGIWSQNSEQIVFGMNYYIGAELEILSGSLYAYVEICDPSPLDLGCKRLFEHEFFNWSGFQLKGTIAENQFLIPLANIAKYEELVMKGN